MTVARPTLLLGAVVVVLAGCGSSSNGESATAFVKRTTTEFSRGQSSRLWSDLAPAEQAVVPRARFLACRRNTGFRLRSFKVLEQFDESFTMLSRSVPSTAVSVQVTSDDGVTTATVHAIHVDGRWRWVLQPADLAAYRAGRCP
jgi:hypothetical protein